MGYDELMARVRAYVSFNRGKVLVAAFIVACAAYIGAKPYASDFAIRWLYTCWPGFDCGNAGEWFSGLVTAFSVWLLARQAWESKVSSYTAGANVAWTPVLETLQEASKATSAVFLDEEGGDEYGGLVAVFSHLKDIEGLEDKWSALPKPLPWKIRALVRGARTAEHHWYVAQDTIRLQRANQGDAQLDEALEHSKAEFYLLLEDVIEDALDIIQRIIPFCGVANPGEIRSLQRYQKQLLTIRQQRERKERQATAKAPG